MSKREEVSIPEFITDLEMNKEIDYLFSLKSKQVDYELTSLKVELAKLVIGFISLIVIISLLVTHIDYPIYYGKGCFSYNFPERIPQKIIRTFEMLIIGLDNSEKTQGISISK